MGLDMYLEARKYVSRIDWKDVPIGGLPDGASMDDYVSAHYKNLAEMFPQRLLKHSHTGAGVTLNVASWRKANQIHSWFVENVQRGEDDCGEYHVGIEDLTKLLDTVNRVLNSGDIKVAEKLLPVREGFFFGSNAYDQFYYEQLQETKTMLEDILTEVKEGEYDYDFYYQSSW